jgi:hypothetical protein
LAPVAIPDLDCVVSEAGHDFGVVVLEAVDAFRVFRPAVDPLEVVLPAAPVVLDGVNVLDDGGVEPAVEAVRWVVLAWPGLEQVLAPVSTFC